MHQGSGIAVGFVAAMYWAEKKSVPIVVCLWICFCMSFVILSTIGSLDLTRMSSVAGQMCILAKEPQLVQSLLLATMFAPMQQLGRRKCSFPCCDDAFFSLTVHFIATRVEAIARRLEAIALRLE